MIMPRKNKTKGRQSKVSLGDARDVAMKAAFAFDSTNLINVEAEPVHYVTLDMQLLNWSYLNFKFRTKTTTRLFTIKQQIRKQHGLITDLKICTGHFSEANELNQDMLTLAEYGINGAPEGEPEVVHLIHYDYKPDQYDNPLLLATGHV